MRWYLHKQVQVGVDCDTIALAVREEQVSLWHYSARRGRGGGNLVGWNSKGMGMKYKHEGENLGELGVRAYRYRVGWEWSLSSMCTCTIVDDLYILVLPLWYIYIHALKQLTKKS